MPRATNTPKSRHKKCGGTGLNLTAGFLPLPVFGNKPFETFGQVRLDRGRMNSRPTLHLWTGFGDWPASTDGKQCAAWAGLSGYTTPGGPGCLKSTHSATVNITPTGVDGVLETSPAAGPGPGRPQRQRHTEPAPLLEFRPWALRSELSSLPADNPNHQQPNQQGQPAEHPQGAPTAHHCLENFHAVSDL